MTHLPVLLMLIVLVCAAPMSGANISIQPNPFLPSPGSTVWADILIRDLNGAVLGGFDLTLSYPSLLSVTGDPVFGTLLGVPGAQAITIVTQTGGHLRLFEVSLLAEEDLRAQQTDPFVLVSVPFTAPAAVSGLLQLSGDLTDAAGMPLQATFSPTVVGNVPEPSTMMLAGEALVVGMLLRRRLASKCKG